MIPAIKTKQDLIKALTRNELKYYAEIEVVNDAGIKSLIDTAKSLLRQQRKVHFALLERT